MINRLQIYIILFICLCSTSIFAESQTNSATASYMVGTAPWDDVQWDDVTVTNIFYLDGINALIDGVNFDSGLYMYQTRTITHNFTIPSSANITGVVIRVARYLADGAKKCTMDLMKLTSNYTIIAAGTNLGNADQWNMTSVGYTNYGSSSSLNGYALTPTIVNAGGFGAAFSLKAANNDCKPRVDHVEIILYYDPPPSLQNTTPTNIGSTFANFNGNLSSTGSSPTFVWLYWGINNGQDTNSNWQYTNSFGQRSTGILTTNITGLSNYTTYYYRYYATNSIGATWASPSSNFTTLAVVPTITNTTPTNITITNAYMNGNLTVTGGAPTFVWLYWGDNDGETTFANWDYTNTFGQRGIGILTTNIIGLIPNTIYYYRYYATNIAGTTWASPSSNFTTISDIPILTNTIATNITDTNAYMNGYLTSTGYASTFITLYWGDNDGTTNISSWEHTNIFSGAQNPGILTTNITGLIPRHVYHYRYYASNSYGVAWGSPAEHFANAASISTIKPAGGGDFTLLQSWEDWADDQSNAAQWAECYTGGNIGSIILMGWNSNINTNEFPKIYAATKSSSTNQIDGPYIQVTTPESPAFVFGNTMPYMEIDGITFVSSTNQDLMAESLLILYGTNSVVRNCKFIGLTPKIDTQSAMTIISTPLTALAGQLVRLENCIYYGYGTNFMPAIKVSTFNTLSVTQDIYVSNCTIYNCSGGINSQVAIGVGSLNLYYNNNTVFDSYWAGEFTTNNEYIVLNNGSGTINVYQAYCFSSDESSDDWGGIGNKTNQILSSCVVATNNLNIKYKSPMINAGTSINQYFRDDFSHTNIWRPRFGLWDIGAFEFNKSTVITITQ